MKLWNAFTIGLGAALTFAPHLLPYLSPTYADAASALVAAATGLFHLHQPPPR